MRVATSDRVRGTALALVAAADCGTGGGAPDPGADPVTPTGTAPATLAVDGLPSGMVGGDGALWVVVGATTVVRVDPATGETTHTVELDQQVTGLTFAEDDGKIDRVALG